MYLNFFREKEGEEYPFMVIEDDQGPKEGHLACCGAVLANMALAIPTCQDNYQLIG